MNKSKIEKFAVEGHKLLYKQIAQRAYQYGIEENNVGKVDATEVRGRIPSPLGYRFYVNGVSVVSGPRKGDLRNHYYETVDIAPYLTPGENYLTARVVAYASLIKKPVTTDLVTEALKDVFPNSKTKEVTMEVIQEIVASYFKIRIEDLHAKKRTRTIAYPRQIAMYLCRELTDTSLPQIGNFFGGRDHTTVLHAYDKIAKEREENAKLHKIIKDLIESIQKM